MPIPAYFFDHRWVLLLLILLTGFIYYPGLHSPFLLDDYYNLGTLDQITIHGYPYYLVNGIAGPSGRPIALLSFALQHQDWPHNPFAFKLVNLLIHLLNGVLVFAISRILAAHLKPDGRENKAVCLLTTALWLLHPVQLSTVLYAVQRMTELSAFFTLTGLYGYLHARTLYEQQQQARHLLVMGTLVVLGTLFGVLSKENGILLPLYIAVIEFTVFADHSRPVSWRIFAWVFLALPLIALAVYLAATLDDTLWNYRTRPFTPVQRLLTEGVVLFNYIFNLCAPHPSAFSLFHDDFPVSLGWLTPSHTLAAMLGICALLVYAVMNRKSHKVISFAILWFFAGHVLESTYLNLELYFEHRNYLPSLGIFFLMGWFSILCLQKLAYRFPPAVLIGAFYLLTISVTVMEVDMWANPVKQAIAWSRTHPKSPRALDNLGSIYLQLGEYEKAHETFHRINEIDALDIYPYVKDISIKYCLMDAGLTDEEWDEIFTRAIKAERHGTGALAELDTLTVEIRKNNCRMGDIYRLMRLVIILAVNPAYEPIRDMLHELAASLAVYLGDGPSALANINESINLEPTPSRYILKIRILIELEMVEESDIALREFRQYLHLHPAYRFSYSDIVDALERQLLELKSLTT